MSRAGDTQTYEFLRGLTDRIISGGVIAREEAERLVRLHTHEEVVMLLGHATRLRNRFKGGRVELCAIANAKSGRCTEDCIFCAQSARYAADVPSYPLREAAAVIDMARDAERSGALRFGIVTSGRGVFSARELAGVCAAVEGICSKTRLTPCASLGVAGDEQMRRLRRAGLRRYHHNLETAESHFPRVCSSHSYQDRVGTIRAAKRAGLEICAGGIFGLGESRRQRVELALALRELDVDSVPLNFLSPIRGTPAEQCPRVAPLEILTIIALFRFVLPAKDIRVCGGRESGLRTLQPLMYLAGANGTMTGNYLTTSGRDPDIDVQEIRDLALEVLAPPDDRAVGGSAVTACMKRNDGT